MRSQSMRLFLSLLVLFVPSVVFAQTVTLTGTINYQTLDGSADDQDHAHDGVFTVSAGDLVINGDILCTDAQSSTNGGCNMVFAVSRDVIINAGGSVVSDNTHGNGSAGKITFNTGRHLVLHGPSGLLPGALVSASSTSSSNSAGGNITANITGAMTLDSGSVITAASKGATSGTIQLTAGGTITANGLVASGAGSTVLFKLAGPVLATGVSHQVGGPITIRSTSFVEPGVSVGGDAVIVSQGLDASGTVRIDGCGVNVRGLVASVSSNGSSRVVIRSGKSMLIQGDDLPVLVNNTGRNARIRADSLSGDALNNRVDLFANEAIQLSSSNLVYVASATPADVKKSGGKVSIISLNNTVTLSGKAVIAGLAVDEDKGGSVDVLARGNISLPGAEIAAIGDVVKVNGTAKGGAINVRSYSGAVSWTNGVGDARPTGSQVAAAARGTIVITACGAVTTSGTQFPTNGPAVGPYPAIGASCSPAAPSLPAGETSLPVCNTPPVANDTSATTNEDNSVTITLSGTDVDGDSLTFSIITPPSHGTLGAINPLNATSATVVYTPALNYNGSDSFVYQANDGNGGTDTANVSLTINPVNDAPSFLAGPNQSVLEDSGAHVVFPWASSISPGPADESAQTVTFTTTNNNNSLFSVQPTVAANGTLSFTSALNAYGTAVVTVTAHDNGGTANGGVDTSAAQTFSITVNGVNDAPSFTRGPDQTVAEDAGPQSVSNWATAISPGPNESSQTVSFLVTGNSNPALFAAGPAVSSTGTLTYTTTLNANGTAMITLVAKDDGGTANGGVDTSAPQSFTITVTAVNDAPSFTGGGDVTLNEDSGAYSAAWASAISAGPADESGQTVAFNVIGNTNTALFAMQPTVNPAGVLSFTPAANAFGSASITVHAQDNGGTANGGVDTSAAQTFTINITAVNDAPGFTPGGNVTVNEDSGPYSAAWASGISAGPNEGSQTVAFTATNDNNGLFSVQPSVSPAGVLTFTSAPNANGSATVTVTLTDNGGTANGGVDTSASVSFTVVVNAVNDAPTFTGSGNVSVNEDSGAYSATWATAINAGAPDESGQTVTFTVTNSNNSLFSVQPSIDGAGVLTFTPSANAFGTATISVTAHDDGGTANGGVDTSATQTFTISVNGVNDAPSFTPGGNVSLNEDSGAYSAPWASAISAGPNESGQTVAFNVANDNASLFAVQPSISATGVLSFTLNANTNGFANVTVSLSDDGGTANGGVDTSAIVSFTITINAVNDAPSFTKGPDQTVLEDSGAHTVPGWATGISAGPADESGQTVTFTASASNPALFSVQPAVTSNGDLTYTLAPDAFGATTIMVTAHDDGGTANGGVDSSAPQTFTITINGVNDAPSFTSGGDVSVNEDSGAYSNPWATGISAGPNESGQTLTFNTSNGTPALFSVQPSISPSGVLMFTPAPNANGTVTVTVTLSDNGGTANGGVDTSAAVTFTITVISVNDPPVAAADSWDTIGNTRLEVNSAPAAAAPTVFTTGSVLANDSDIDGPNALTATLIAGSVAPGAVVTLSSDGTFIYIPAPGFSGNDTFQYSVSDGSASATGTVTIHVFGRVWYVNNSGGAGDGRSHNAFNTLAAAQSASVFGDTIFVYNGNNTTTGQNSGIALKSNQRLIGAGVALTMPFSVNGGSNPTTLVAAGAKAKLTNTAGSGVTAILGGSVEIAGVEISGSSAHGIALAGNSSATIRVTNVQSSGDDGINGANVSSLNLTTVTVLANGNAVGDNGIEINGLFGTSSINSSEVSGSFENNVQIANSSGTLALSGSNNTIRNTSNAAGNTGFSVLASGSAAMTATITNTSFNGNRTIAARGDAAGTSVLNFSITGSQFTAGTSGNPRGNQAIEVTASATANVTFAVDNNIITGLANTGINIFGANTSVMNGTVTGNSVTNAGAGFSGFGIRVINNAQASVGARIDNNTVSNVGLDYGIFADSFGALVVPPPGQGSLKIAVTNNNISVLSGALDAIRVQARNNNSVCGRITGNATNAGGAGSFGIFVRQANAATFNLEGLAAGAQSAATTQTFVQSQNPAAATVGATATTSFTGVASGFCPIP